MEATEKFAEVSGGLEILSILNLIKEVMYHY